LGVILMETNDYFRFCHDRLDLHQAPAIFRNSSRRTPPL
jgi:hypothetical protein